MAVNFALEVILKGLDHLTTPLRGATTQMDRLNRSAERMAKFGQGAQSIGRGAAMMGAAVAAGTGKIMSQGLELSRLKMSLENTFNRSNEGRWVDDVVTLTEKLGQDLPASVADVTALATAYRMAGGTPRSWQRVA